MDTDAPWARMVLVVGGHELPLGAVGPRACDLGLVDDLLGLGLALGRHGAALRLVDVRAELHELLDLVGVPDVLGLPASGGDPARRDLDEGRAAEPQASMRSGRPKRGNSSG